jgi:hypothetical protein
MRFSKEGDVDRCFSLKRRGAAICAVAGLAVLYPLNARAQELSGCTASARNADAAPLLFQHSVKTSPPALPTAEADDPMTKETGEKQLVVYRIPQDRFALIRSVAVKGTHPPNSYLALELGTYIRSAGAGTNGIGRHLLYAKESAPQEREVHVREELPVAVGGPGTSVTFGVQVTKDTIYKPFVITITGTLYDCRDWGKRP